MCHKLKFCNPFIVGTKCLRPEIFKTMNSVRLNNLSLKYQWFILLGCKDIGIRKLELVTKTQFQVVPQTCRV